MGNWPQNFGLGLAAQVWQFSQMDVYNNIRPVGYPPFITPVQAARLERIRQARLLFDGAHRRLFLYEGRTQFNFPQVMAQGAVRQLYLSFNLLRLVSLKSADLLFAEEPQFRCDDPDQQLALTDLVVRTSLTRLLHAQAVECSGDAEAMVETVIENGKVYIKRVDAADIMPEGKLQADGQYASYVRYNAANLGTEDRPQWSLLTTRYTAGAITRTVEELDEMGRPQRLLTLDVWPQEDPESDPMPATTNTGISRNTITWIPNLLNRDQAVSDYDGLLELQDELNAKQTQIARVLAKHSDPKLAAPDSTASDDGTLPAGHDVFFFRSKEEIPQYITWNAELSAAMQDREFTRDSLLIAAEMSPALLGLQQGASSAETWKKVKLSAINATSKAGRKSTIWKSVIRRMLEVAQELENTLPGVRYERTPIGIQMRDGLPVDTGDQANEIATLRACGSMSVRRSVEIQLTDPAQVDLEIAEIEEDGAKATPSVFLTHPETAPVPGMGTDAGGQMPEVGNQMSEVGNQKMNDKTASTGSGPL